MLNLSIDVQILACLPQVLPAPLTAKTFEETFEKNVSSFYVLLFP